MRSYFKHFSQVIELLDDSLFERQAFIVKQTKKLMLLFDSDAYSGDPELELLYSDLRQLVLNSKAIDPVKDLFRKQ